MDFPARTQNRPLEDNVVGDQLIAFFGRPLCQAESRAARNASLRSKRLSDPYSGSFRRIRPLKAGPDGPRLLGPQIP